MIIIMEEQAESSEIKAVQDRIKSEGFPYHVIRGDEQIIISIIGDTRLIKDVPFERYESVSHVVHTQNSYKLTSRDFKADDSIVNVSGLKIGGNEPFITMAGPCSIESQEQIMECARIAKEGGAKVLRGGAFKPRTSPYAFQGLGEKGLIYIRKAADHYGLKVITEVMDEANLPLVARYTDILQIGARNMQNFKLLQAVGKTGMPVALKRGIAGTIDEWLNAAEYIVAEGNFNIIFVERGIRTYETATRNTFDLSAVPVIQKLSHFPIIVDPSHGVGEWDYVAPMALAGVASGASGMIVEIHPEPQKAWSDGQQSLNEKRYLNMMAQVDVLSDTMKTIKSIQNDI